MMTISYPSRSRFLVILFHGFFLVKNIHAFAKLPLTHHTTTGTSTWASSTLLALSSSTTSTPSIEASNTATVTIDHQKSSRTDDSFILVSRATELAITAIDLARPLLLSGLGTILTNHKTNIGISDNDPWERFWSAKSINEKKSNAQKVVQSLEKLGPTYVKFGQALASRPDIIPKSLAEALCTLQDNMEPFDTNTAKEIIKNELLLSSSSGIDNYFNDQNALMKEEGKNVQSLIESLSNEPVAAASVGQVYKGYLPNYGYVAVKVQRPEIKNLVEKDAALLRNVASFIESIPSLSFHSNSATTKEEESNGNKNSRLINTELVAAVDEFMSRIFEELDYLNEANNAKIFAKLYSTKNGISIKSLPNGEGVIVPEIIESLCTKNVIVMEWIDGSKLTSISNDNVSLLDGSAEEMRQENLALVEKALYVTLSQLLDTGVMHADPHGGNLLKVSPPSPNTSSNSKPHKEQRRRRRLSKKLHSATSYFKKDPIPTLAYLDFGLLATIPVPVRDGLVCAVAQLVFAKDVEAVASLFGELDLLPNEVISDPIERKALTNALTKTMGEVLKYPPGETLYCDNTSGNNQTTTTNARSIPSLEFDKLLDGLTRLVPRFKFRLPPYFINNARALGTLEGTARSLDPNFNCLQLMYPYAIYRLLQNPTNSPVVASTLQSLIRSKETGKIDRQKVTTLLREVSLFTGFSRRKVLMDVLRTKGGKNLIMYSLISETKDMLSRRWSQRPTRPFRTRGLFSRRLTYFKL